MSLNDQFVALKALLTDLEGRVSRIASLPKQFEAVTSEIMQLVTSQNASHYLAQWFRIYTAFIDEVMVLDNGELWREYHVRENVSKIYDGKEGYYKRKITSVSVDGLNFFCARFETALEAQTSVKKSERDRLTDALDDLVSQLDQNAKMRIEQVRLDLRSQVVKISKKLEHMNLLGSRGEGGFYFDRHLAETWDLYKLARVDSMRTMRKDVALSTSIVFPEEDVSLKCNKQTKKKNLFEFVDAEEIAIEAKKKKEMEKVKEQARKAEEERQKTDFFMDASINAIKQDFGVIVNLELEESDAEEQEEEEEWGSMQDDDAAAAPLPSKLNSVMVAASLSTASTQQSMKRPAGGNHHAPSNNKKAKQQRSNPTYVAKGAVNCDGIPQPVTQLITVMVQLPSIQVQLKLCASFCSLTEAGKKLVSTSTVLEEVFRRLWAKPPIDWPQVPKSLQIGEELYSRGSHFLLSSTSTMIQVLCFESALLSELQGVLKEEVGLLGRTPDVEFVFRLFSSLELLTASSRSDDVYLDFSHLGSALVESASFLCQVLNFLTTSLSGCTLHINVSGCSLDDHLLLKLISFATTLQVAHCGAITLGDSCTLAFGSQLNSFSLSNTSLSLMLQHVRSAKDFMCSLLSNCKKLSKLNLSYCVGNSAHMERLTQMLLEAIQARQAASTATAAESFTPLTIQLHGAEEAHPAIIEAFLRNAYASLESLVVEVQGVSLSLY